MLNIILEIVHRMACFKILLLISFIFQAIQCFDSDPHPNCTSVVISNDNLLVYIGWPHEIRCNLFLESGEIYHLYDEDLMSRDDDVVCLIWKTNGSLVYNKTTTFSDVLYDSDGFYGHRLPDLQDGDDVDFVMQLQGRTISSCLTMDIHLNLTRFPQETCQEFLEKSPIQRNQNDIGKLRILACEAETYQKIENNATYKWERNCSELPGNASVTKSHELSIPSLSFDHAGLYTCSVTYKKMTRYVVVYPTCVHYPVTTSQATFQCSQSRLQENIGEEAEFKCDGDFGTGNIRHDPAVRWQKVDSVGAKSTLQFCVSTDKQPIDDDAEGPSCRYELGTNDCFLHVASEEERKIPPAKVFVYFKIRNIKSEHYGIYSILLTNDVIVNVTLESDPKPVLHTEIVIVVLPIGAVVILIILLLLMIHYRLYIKVYYKRYFGVYIADDKSYGAFLAYHFSNEIDTFMQDDMKQTVPELRKILEKLGYKVYDERRDGFIEQSRADNMEHSTKISHRVVIFLTLEFIKDEWSLFIMQRGFEEMVESGSKLIFILFPGIKEYLKQHANYDETCRMIQRAVKLNYVIHLTKDKKFNHKRDFFIIEEAMPKLKSQTSSRKDSELSNNNTNGMNYKDVNYQRCFSNQTDVTVLDSPGLDEVHFNIENLPPKHEQTIT